MQVTKFIPIKTRFSLLISLLTCLVPFAGDLAAQQGYTMDASMSMKQFQEQVLKPKEEVWVVDFWASWCRPCLASIPEVKNVQKSYEGKPVRFISLSWDEDKSAWSAMAERMQMPWQQILIPDVRNAPFINKHFAHKTIPSLFVVDKTGKVKKVADPYVLSKAIDKAMGKS